jgi:hypothetical protein
LPCPDRRALIAGVAARSGVTLAAVSLAALAGCLPAWAGGSPLSLKPIAAVFLPKDLATQYAVSASDSSLPAGKSLSYTWTLTLKLVDKAGTPAPGESGGAAVDPTCDNSYLPGSTNPKPDVYVWAGLGASFVWYHGDAGTYMTMEPFGSSMYGCDHSKMGPSGHQGVVTVAVGDGSWICTESIAGTNLGLTPQYGGAAVCSRPTKLEMQISSLQAAIAKTQKALANPGAAGLDGAGLTLDLALSLLKNDLDPGSAAYGDATLAEDAAHNGTHSRDPTVKKLELAKAVAGANKLLTALTTLQGTGG